MKKIFGVLLLTALALACGSGDDKTTAATPAAPAAPAATATNPALPPGTTKRVVDPEKLAARNAGAQIKQGELPDGFPQDLLYPGSQPKTSMLVGGSGLVMLSSDKPIADVLSHYREQLPSAGWTVDSVKESTDGNKASLKAHKDLQSATISINQGQGGVGTEIGIGISGSS